MNNIDMTRCANCGIAANDNVKLSTCGSCLSIRYCGIKCQKAHRPEHKKACKQRAAELRDELLFQQPKSSHLGDCPICFLPLPLESHTRDYMNCCSTPVCFGCMRSDIKRIIDGGHEMKCPFCRKPTLISEKQTELNLQERIDVNDPIALHNMGQIHFEKGDYEGAFEWYSKAAALGDVAAHYDLATLLYQDGKGVQKNPKKRQRHLEEAAIGGHPGARYHLAFIEDMNFRNDRMVKHLIIAAKLGLNEALDMLEKFHKSGKVTKDELVAAHRGYQAAVAATKSSAREEAEKMISKSDWNRSTLPIRQINLM